MSSIKNNAFYSALLSVSAVLAPLISFPYVARVLHPEGIGLVSFSTTFIQYFLLITALGLPNYGIREIAKARDDRNKRSKILFELFSVRLILSLVVILFYVVAIILSPKLYSTRLFYWWGILSIVSGIFDINWFFNGMEKFKYIAVRGIFFQVLQVASYFILVKSKNDTLTYFLIPIFITLLNNVVNVIYAFRFINFKPLHLSLDLGSHVRPMLLLFASIFAISIYNFLDTVLLGFFTNDLYVGYYSLAVRISKFPITFILILVPVLMPRISIALAKKEFDEVKSLTANTLNFVITLGLPISAGFFILAPEIIEIMGGAKFSPSVTTLRVLSPLIFVIGMTNNFSSQLLIPMGADKKLLIAVSWGTVVSIISNIVLIPSLGYNGAAITSLISEVVVFFTCFRYTNRIISISLPYRLIGSQLLVVAVFLPVTLLMRHFFSSPLYILCLTTVICVIYYLAAQLFILKNALVQNLFNGFLSNGVLLFKHK